VSGLPPLAGATTDGLASPAKISLTASSGDVVNLDGELEQSSIVLYFFPGAQVSPEEGHESPELDAAQHRAFDEHRDNFLALNSLVLGVSSQPHEQQRVAAADLQHLLLSDPTARLADELNLRTFSMNDTRWYCRAVVVLAREKAHVLSQTRGAGASASQTIAWMRAQGL